MVGLCIFGRAGGVNVGASVEGALVGWDVGCVDSILDVVGGVLDGFKEGSIVEDSAILHGETSAHVSAQNLFSDCGR